MTARAKEFRKSANEAERRVWSLVRSDTHGDDGAEESDRKRQEDLQRAGYTVIRFWNDYVLTHEDGGVADMILEALMTSALPEADKRRLVLEMDPANDGPGSRPPSPSH